MVAYYYFAEAALKSVAADETIASFAVAVEYEYGAAAAAVHEPPSADDGSSLPDDVVADVCSELQPCHSFDVSPPP